ncbi:MAG: hypothetical protein HC769_22755 [Cyanobacteria bacterium CRU_2_1]|nr:hypothetical protein [Cyanobacteria bacterium RU_5_0]NJR61404.1 hypothetical protein [Cyanobacteria bacterium CRU_2_1]
MNTMQHESLFTELTAEQAAIVEGGVLVRLGTIKGQPFSTRGSVGHRTIFGGSPSEVSYEFYVPKRAISKRGRVDIALDPQFGSIKFSLYDDRDRDGYAGNHIGTYSKGKLTNGRLAPGVYRVKVHSPSTTSLAGHNEYTLTIDTFLR